jgi:fucose permease
VHLADTTAAYQLAGLWGSIVLARIALSRILLFLRGESLIVASGAGTALGVVLLMCAHGPLLAWIAVVTIGFCSAAIFPTTLGLAAARFEKYSGSVFGILIAVALLGGMTLPWLLGHLASAFTLRAALTIVIFDALAIVALLAAYRSLTVAAR